MYTRRRTVQSIPQPHEDVPCECHAWSCFGLLGALLVQVACHSTFASFGVMLSFLLGDEGPSWELLTVPIAFVVTWNVSEPIMQGLTPHTDVRKLWIAVVAGSALGGQGAFWAAKSPILFDYLIPLVGVVCGCGAGVSKWACSGLVKDYLPPHPWSVRLFDQVTAAFAFLVIPLLSFFLMDAFGDHGGLLMHCGILMQGIVGGFLLRISKPLKRYNDRRHEGRQYSITREVVPKIIISTDDGSKVKRMDSPVQQPRPLPQWPRRNAFNLQNSRPTTKETLYSLRRPSLPCILEEDEIFSGGASNRSSAEVSTSRLSQTLPRSQRTNAFNLKLTATIEEDRSTSNTTLLPSPDDTHDDEMSVETRRLIFQTNRNNAISLTDSPIDEEPQFHEATETIFEPCPEAAVEKNIIEKQPRTFEHVFPPGRLVATLQDEQSCRLEHDVKNHCKQKKKKEERVEDCERGAISLNCCQQWRETQIKWPGCRLSWELTKNWRELFSPDYLLCSLLIFSCQNALLTFSALTPVLIKEYILDAEEMDGAYCVCVMGFTWLCFVVASPCFSTIQSSSHQIICIGALCTSSLTLYMVSQVRTLDEMVLYSSLFGLSYGVTTLTTHSILKVNLRTPLLPFLSPKLSILVSIFHFIVLLISGVGQWGDHLKALYILPTCALGLTAVLWTIHSCVAGVRNRSDPAFTWSRPRRFS